MEIAHRDLAALYAFWGSKRGQRAYPARRDFLPEEFRDWMGHIGIVEAEYDPQRFKVRLSGTFIVDYEGRDYTGKYLDDVVPPHDLDDVVAPYTRVIETGSLPTWCLNRAFGGCPPGIHTGCCCPAPVMARRSIR